MRRKILSVFFWRNANKVLTFKCISFLYFFVSFFAGESQFNSSCLINLDDVTVYNQIDKKHFAH